MVSPYCYIIIDDVMPVGTYAVGIKISDYISGNPNQMSTIPGKFIINIVPNSKCNNRYQKLLLMFIF